MRAILIDPFAKTATEVEHDGTLADIYKHTKCSIIDIVRIDSRDVLYVDDEGLFKPNQHYFQIHNQGKFAGRALLLGTNSEGESIATNVSLSTAQRAFTFFDKQPVFDHVDTASGEVDDPILGKVATITQTAKFK